jgi:large subunit ribosomal protein L7Ae
MPKKTTQATTGAKPATKGAKKPATKFSPSVLIEKKPRNFGIGQAIQPRRDVTRFVKWPHYIKLQRQRRILTSRMKIPPSVNQFTKALDKASATSLFKLLQKYRPEDKAQKKQRLTKLAEAKAKGETVQPAAKGNQIIFGLNKVVRAIESKKAKLVVLAHDVDPIELVVWIPALCRKLGVPFCVIKGKARLGAVVHHKTATTLAIVNVDKEDVKDLSNLTDLCLQSYNNNTELRRQWGGGQLGIKAVAAKKKKERAVAKEDAARQKV